jgi:hypothetical protein
MEIILHRTSAVRNPRIKRQLDSRDSGLTKDSSRLRLFFDLNGMFLFQTVTGF